MGRFSTVGLRAFVMTLSMDLLSPIPSPAASPIAGALDITARDSSRLSDQRVFASVMSRARQSEPIDPVQAASEGAENLISVALVQPMLSKLRDSSWATEPFKPTSGEKSFRGMLDNAFALKIVRGGNWPLVEKVKQRLLARVQQAPQAGSVEQAAIPHASVSLMPSSDAITTSTSIRQ